MLSHLIAEPIPGNCYMWSAPLQPFVLPVRVRSFEALYKQNVKDDKDASPSGGTQVQEVLAVLSSAEDELKGKLVAALKEHNVKFIEVAGGGQREETLIGVFSGQLYHLIKDAKSQSDTRNEEQLKKPLMEAILGTGNVKVQVVPKDNREYFVARLADWTTALGKAPHVRHL